MSCFHDGSDTDLGSDYIGYICIRMGTRDGVIVVIDRFVIGDAVIGIQDLFY